MEAKSETVYILCSNIYHNWFWDFFSDGLKDFENTNFSHVAILDKDQIYEAVYPKAQEIPYKDWLETHTIYKTYALDLTPTQYKQFMEIVFDFMGTRYSLTQLFLIWLTHKSSIAKRYFKNHLWNGRHRSICTEVVALPIMEVLGYKFGEGEDTIGLDEVEECLKTIGREVPQV